MAPTLSTLTPNSGPESVFNTVVITGTGFADVGPLTVRFGATATTFTIDSDTQITAIAPPGTGTVQVTVQALLDGTSNGLPYTYIGTTVPALVYASDGFNPGTVYSMPSTGGTATPVAIAPPLNAPAGLARVGNTLYIAESGANRVVSVPVTGGAPTPLVTGLNNPVDVAVSGSTLFIAEAGATRVVSAPIAGGPFTPVATIPTGVFGVTA